MGKIIASCNKCKKEFFTGFDMPVESLGKGNSSKCPCGNVVVLTKENVREE